MQTISGSSRRRVRRAVGLLAPVVCGLAFSPVMGAIGSAWSSSDANTPAEIGDYLLLLQVGLLALVGIVGALLLRTWWAPFAILPAFFVGLFAWVVIATVQAGPTGGGDPDAPLVWGLFLVLASLPMLVGAGLVTIIDLALQRRREHAHSEQVAQTVAPQ
jgi:hypothetical protein